MIPPELIGAGFLIETVPRAQFCLGNQYDGGSWNRVIVLILYDAFDSRAIMRQGDFQGQLPLVGDSEAFLHHLGILGANTLRYKIATCIHLHFIASRRQARGE